jgi:predicted nucleotidyltransferase
MTVQTVTLTMPDVVYQRAQRAAEALRRPVEDLLVDTLTATLPPLDDVPVEMTSEIVAMTHLSDDALYGLATSTLPQERQDLMHDLLDQQERGVLKEADRRQLVALVAESNRALLRRSKAAALLVARGKPLPQPALPKGTKGGETVRPFVAHPQLKAVLQALRQELARVLGSQFVQLILFGSHARGDARPDSDIDVLVVVQDDADRAYWQQATLEGVARICLEYDVVISHFFVSAAQYEQAPTAFLQNVRREGIPA